MATLTNLPTELLIMILSRLPLKILSSFKLVCKFWYALINDPTNSSLQHKSILLLHIIRDFKSCKFIYSILKFSHDLDRSISIIDFDFLSCKDTPSSHIFSKICGQAHGLFCLSHDKDVFLFNLTTKEFRKLPPSILHYTKSVYKSHYSASNAVGFGYDSKSRDFKVVRVVEFVHIYDETGPTRVEIYDLRKDRWREIESPIRGRVLTIFSFEMYHEGTYYWWSQEIRGSNIIQTFDMSEEVFDEISVPDYLAKVHAIYITLGILNGSIVIFYHRTEVEKVIYIWEMKKDEHDVVSWSKLFAIGPTFGIENPLFVVSSNEVLRPINEKPLLFVSSDELLMQTNEGKLIFYNTKTYRVKPISIEGPRSEFCATFFDHSLLSVKGGHNVLYEF